MKSKCKTLTIACNELLINVKIFFIYLVVLAILISVFLSIFRLAIDAPTEMNEFVKNSRYSNITVFNVNTENIENIKGVNAQYHCVQYNLNTRKLGIIDDNSDDGNSMLATAQYLIEDSENSVISQLKKNLIDGEEWTVEDNNTSSIWLLKSFANELNVNVGDNIKLYDFNDNFCTNLTVKGIYKFSFSLVYSYIINLNTYEKLDYYNNTNVVIVPNKVYEYSKTISNLQNIGFVVDANFDAIKSIMTLIYALFAFSVLIFFITISVLFNFLENYFAVRKRHFAVYQAIGIRTSSLFKISFVVLQTVITVAFLISICSYPFITKYIIGVIKSLFNEVSIYSKITFPNMLISYIVLTIVVFIVCVVKYYVLKTNNPIKNIRER